MKTILEFPIKVIESQTIAMPKDAAIVFVGVQNDTPCVLAIVHTGRQLETRTFEIYGTGQRMLEDTEQEGRMYIGTFQMFPLVWHLFERCVLMDESAIALDAI